ncbi:MAG: hypothetical protein QXU95_02740, partial [Candidatus Bathyarchaeia archaeon]
MEPILSRVPEDQIEKVAGPRGIEPPTLGLGGWIKPISWKELQNGFLLWAKARFSPAYVRDLKYILDKHQPVIGRLEDLEGLFAGDFP